jgi:hypothetical protein
MRQAQQRGTQVEGQRPRRRRDGGRQRTSRRARNGACTSSTMSSRAAMRHVAQIWIGAEPLLAMDQQRAPARARHPSAVAYDAACRDRRAGERHSYSAKPSSPSDSSATPHQCASTCRDRIRSPYDRRQLRPGSAGTSAGARPAAAPTWAGSRQAPAGGGQLRRPCADRSEAAAPMRIGTVGRERKRSSAATSAASDR